jgi:hypothetical protein
MKIHKKDNTIKNQKWAFPEKQFITTFASEKTGLVPRAKRFGISGWKK